MQAPAVVKYGFRIRTRIGLVVDNLKIPGRDAEDAERKLRQIYRDCEILERICLRTGTKQAEAAPLNCEDRVSLIAAYRG